MHNYPQNSGAWNDEAPTYLSSVSVKNKHDISIVQTFLILKCKQDQDPSELLLESNG